MIFHFVRIVFGWRIKVSNQTNYGSIDVARGVPDLQDASPRSSNDRAARGLPRRMKDLPDSDYYPGIGRSVAISTASRTIVSSLRKAGKFVMDLAPDSPPSNLRRTMVVD